MAAPNYRLTPATVNGLQLSNSGDGPLVAPGFAGIAIDAERGNGYSEEGPAWWSSPMRATAREVAMVGLMNEITDRPNWQQEVFDEVGTERLANLATTFSDLISAKAWAWCLEELRLKANNFKQTGRVMALDIGNAVCKFDDPVQNFTHVGIQKGLEALRKKTTCTGQIQDLIDPSLHPLTYASTPILLDEGCIDLQKVDATYDTARVMPPARFLDSRPSYDELTAYLADTNEFSHRWDINALSYASLGQWLPCEVEFGDSHKTPRITSYINNLHPKLHSDLYRALEQLLLPTISAWNDTIITSGHGTSPIRIRTYGVETEHPTLPDWYNELCHFEQALSKKEKTAASGPPLYDRSSPDYIRYRSKVEAYLQLPETAGGLSWPESWWWPKVSREEIDGDWEKYLSHAAWAKWAKLRKAKHPEPGTAFSFGDWIAGRNSQDIIPSRYPYTGPETNHVVESVSLQNSFRDQSFQVIVKATSIELRPGERDDICETFVGDEDWQADSGALNEHIAATAMYFVEVDNTTAISVEFRQMSFVMEDDYRFKPTEEVFQKVFDMPEDLNEEKIPNFQRLGNIQVRAGRLIAFPVSLQRRLQPFSLRDRSRPGRLSFITLYLVDPCWRIASTRNVPPQQEESLGNDIFQTLSEILGSKLPPELIHQIAAEFVDWEPPSGDALRDKRRADRERDLTWNARKDMFMQETGYLERVGYG